jgi:hypothetical protein
LHSGIALIETDNQASIANYGLIKKSGSVGLPEINQFFNILTYRLLQAKETGVRHQNGQKHGM